MSIADFPTQGKSECQSMPENLTDNLLHTLRSVIELEWNLEFEDEQNDECGCFLPEQSCPVCRAAARLVYDDLPFGSER